MKKRSFLVTALAVVLASVISVGGTLAYLTAKDDKVVNTFKFADNMEVTLVEEEPEKTGEETITGNKESGWNYDNVVPGQTLNKAPKIGTKTEVKAYVFVKISGATLQVHPVEIVNDWLPLNGTGYADDNYNGIYYKAVDGKVDASGNMEEQDLKTIFEKVVISNEGLQGTTTVTLDDIKVEVYEIQQAGFETVQKAAEECVWDPETPATEPTV